MRTMLLTGLLIAAIACIGVFFTASAAEENGALRGSAEAKYFGREYGLPYNGSFRSELTDLEKQLYDVLYDRLIVQKSYDDFDNTVFSDQLILQDANNTDTFTSLQYSVSNTWVAFNYDYPEIYVVLHLKLNVILNGNTVERSWFSFEKEMYPNACSQLGLILNGIDQAVNSIKAARQSDSRYDTVKAIHDYICENADYDYEAAAEMDMDEAHTAAPLFGGGRRGNKLVCEGYARAFKILCARLNVPAAHVIGTTPYGSHAWNYVQMDDGEWYGMDTTWDDSTATYSYFLSGKNTAPPNDSAAFIDTHVPFGGYYSSLDNGSGKWGYPELAEYEYVPFNSVNFWGDSAPFGQTVSGIVQVTLKYKGQLPTDATVDIYVKDTSSGYNSYGAYPVDENGFVTVEIDTTELNQRSSLEVKAECNGFAVSRVYKLNNTVLELLNWEGENPVFSGITALKLKGYSTTDVTRKTVDVHVDGSHSQTVRLDADGLGSYLLDTTALTNGSHTARFLIRNSQGSDNDTIYKSFRVYNAADGESFAFWESAAEQGRVVGEFAGFTVHYNGEINQNCRLDAYLDSQKVQVFAPNKKNVLDAFDADGFCTFYMDVRDRTNGPHAVRFDLTDGNGSTVSLSNTVFVSDGYFTISNWTTENPIFFDEAPVDFQRVSDDPGDQFQFTWSFYRKFDHWHTYRSQAEYFEQVTMEFDTYENGEYFFTAAMKTADGVTVEKAYRFRVNKNFGFYRVFRSDIDLVGDVVELPLKYTGQITGNCRINVYIDNQPVQFWFSNRNPITSAFDSEGKCKILVDARSQSEGRHVVRAELIENNGGVQIAETTIDVTKGYFEFDNWAETLEVIPGTKSTFRFKNTSGESSSACGFSVAMDGYAIDSYPSYSLSYGVSDENDITVTCDLSAYIPLYSVQYYALKIDFTTPAGVKVEKIRRFCIVDATSVTYDVTPNINGGASKLYEPWGLRYYAVFTGADTDKITDRGIAILKDTYYTSGMTPAQFCANSNATIFLSSRNELTFEAATSSNPNGRWFATLTQGIYSYDIGAKYYVVPFAVMKNGRTVYGKIKSNSMENILRANLKLSTITKEEKAICTCILELKNSVASHYEAAGVPGASVDMNIPRGSSQTAATVKTAEETGITPNVVGGASRLIEPWGLRYFATYADSSDVAQRGMVILSEKYYQSSYSSSPDRMRLNANAYVFRDSDGTLLKQRETNRYYGTVTEGISSKDIADVYYVVPFVVLNDGSYVYGTVKSNSMMKIMKANLNSSSVPATERAVSQDIIDLYNAVKAYYAAP